MGEHSEPNCTTAQPCVLVVGFFLGKGKAKVMRMDVRYLFGLFCLVFQRDDVGASTPEPRLLLGQVFT